MSDDYIIGKTAFVPTCWPVVNPVAGTPLVPFHIDAPPSHPRVPKIPPRLRPVPERNEIEFVSNDSGEVLFTLHARRAADYARQILNAVYETEGAHRHLQASGSRTPTGG